MTDEMLKNAWPEWQIVGEPIGRGSLGEVYKAVRREYSVESYAAIKVIRIPQNHEEIDYLWAEGLSRESVKEYLQGIVVNYVREIQLMESLQALNNIVSVKDYKVTEKEDGLGWTIYIRMELLTPLITYARDHEMSEAEVIKLGTDLCSALESCEKRQIIHRGINPDHIFLNDFGEYKLGGFDNSEILGDLTGGISRNGSYGYLAPEAARGDSYDRTVDLYSLGLVLHRLLNRNQPPFLETEQQLKNPSEYMRALQRRMNGETLNSPCDASPAMAEVILKACAYQPSDRYASATEMKHALMSVANGTYRSQQKESDAGDAAIAVHSDSATTVHSDSATAVQKPVKDGRKRKITISVSAVCAAIVLAILLKTVFVPNYRYREAVALYNAGQYEEAITAFEALEGYKDSENRIENCNIAIKENIYNEALAFYRAGKYEEAIVAFEELNGYRDSKEQIEKCSDTSIKEEQYNAAVALIDEGKYEEAITAFKEMNGYKDSKKQIEKCNTTIKDVQYNAAIDLYNAGKYEEAITAFEKIGGYRDSAERAKEIGKEHPNAFLKNAKAGDTVIFGKYEQDNSKSNGQEDIEWLVLDRKKDQLLLVSKYALDCQQYHSKYTFVTWETCDLRKWLNEEFLREAFATEEQMLIAQTSVSADRNPEYSTNPGNDTNDKIFLLSIDEALKYFSSNEARRCAPTAYAKKRGVYTSSENTTAGGEATCVWWLRSPGCSGRRAAGVHDDGAVLCLGFLVRLDNIGVRPALWIDLNA